MRVLLIHSDAQYLGGAEKMLGYYLEGLRTINCQPTVAIVPGSRVGEVIPTSVPRLWLPEKQQFSIRKLLRQAWHILKARREFPFDVAHGWTARDWELASTVGSLARRPAIGTLHDHPLARAISRSRRILMRACARRGLETVVCVSQAVSTACVRAHYPADKLTVIRNGLPGFGDMPERTVRPICRLGFLGVFTERKGLDVLFLMLDELARLSPVPWQAAVAGAAQDSAGEGLMAGIRARFDRKPWWRQVVWNGWVDKPVEFLKTLDLLIVPSSEFDPFPTVLLEAGAIGTPVLAANVGGVDEIVIPDKTGWLFHRGNWREAAGILARVLASPDQLKAAGVEAHDRVGREFTLGKMVDNYLRVYSTIGSDA